MVDFMIGTELVWARLNATKDRKIPPLYVKAIHIYIYIQQRCYNCLMTQHLEEMRSPETELSTGTLYQQNIIHILPYLSHHNTSHN